MTLEQPFGDSSSVVREKSDYTQLQREREKHAKNPLSLLSLPVHAVTLEHRAIKIWFSPCFSSYGVGINLEQEK